VFSLNEGYIVSKITSLYSTYGSGDYNVKNCSKTTNS